MEENIFNDINFGPSKTTKSKDYYYSETKEDFNGEDNWLGFIVTPNEEIDYFTQGKNYEVVGCNGDYIDLIDDEGDENTQYKCSFDIV